MFNLGVEGASRGMTCGVFVVLCGFHPEGGRWKREGWLAFELSRALLVAASYVLWWLLLIVLYI